ncbi:MAG: alpha-glucan family phosphorylase, partial [Actinomycetota bacterium]|nr:alpha-glucan family phosphorylase [Actinomycetota bacterium]
SRRMFQSLWPDVPVDEVPITSVTNGVHAHTWISPEMDDLFSRYVLPAWNEAEAEDWARIDDIRDDELWRAREQGRDRLVEFVRNRLRQSLVNRGSSASDASWADEALDPRILTIGFARRFATYKRANLLLSQPDRLKALLLSPDRPLQIVFAGKAHPHDDQGKEMIRQIISFSSDPEIRHRITFVPDYDIAVARTMYQGCDVWLNNPRRPLEACGTSGEKAALNGVLNLSILDGWWDEMFDGENGWAISSAEGYEDLVRRDTVEAGSLFDLLERQVVPQFYDRSEGPVPRRWVRRIKSCLRSLGPQVVASRMVRDYVEQLYEPIASQADALSADGNERARALASWKARVTTGWDAVKIVSVETEAAVTDLGTARHVDAVVELGSLQPDDVAVELLHGVVGPNDELVAPQRVAMSFGRDDGRYTGEFACETAGRYGFTVRVVPAHVDLTTPLELGAIAWA